MCFSVGNDKQTIKHFYPFFFFILSPTGIPVHAILFAYMGKFWGKSVSACGEK
jgi:hypothetical protein